MDQNKNSITAWDGLKKKIMMEMSLVLKNKLSKGKREES